MDGHHDWTRNAYGNWIERTVKQIEVVQARSAFQCSLAKRRILTGGHGDSLSGTSFQGWDWISRVFVGDEFEIRLCLKRNQRPEQFGNVGPDTGIVVPARIKADSHFFF